MKVLSFVLAFLFMGLTLAPCADTFCPEDAFHTDIEYSISHSTDSGTAHSDHCSPLCVCGCCSTLTTQFEIGWEDYILKPVPGDEEETGFQLPAVGLVYLPIWEPPQIMS